MRWTIEKTKRKISSREFDGHSDHVEESGKRASGVIEYGVESGVPHFSLTAVFPLFRIQQENTTKAHLMTEVKPINFGGRFVKVEFDGNLHVIAEKDGVRIRYVFYPSVEYPIFYERVEFYNGGDEPASFTFGGTERLDNRFCCEGFAYVERSADKPLAVVPAGGKETVTVAFSARYANGKVAEEKNSYLKRKRRISRLINNCDITTGDEVLDTLAAFCRVRVGESIFKTDKGYINSPGGKQYYIGAWTNDTSQYAAPFFAFNDDAIERNAALTAMEYYEPFMNDAFEPIPSSIIVGGRDYWNMRRDRGDAAMFLSGNCRYFLNRNEIPDDRYFKMLKWCAEYTERMITEDGVVYSDTDEMEYRLSAGINLSTSSIAYGAFGAWATLLKRAGKNAESERITRLNEKLRAAIEKYFGADVSGYRTYDYHKNLGEMRAWDCLPPYYGITDRAEETLKAIKDKLYKNGEVYSCERKEEMWDRSGLYYFAALFRCGYADDGFKMLKEYSEKRLLGEHVPYPVERLPEGYHLSDECALYNRIFLDGMLKITYTEKGCLIEPSLPESVKELKIRRIVLSGELRDINVGADRITVYTYGKGEKVYDGAKKIIL